MSQALHDRIAELEAQNAELLDQCGKTLKESIARGNENDELRAEVAALRFAAQKESARTSDLQARLAKAENFAVDRPFAIVMDRHYEGSGLALAVHVGSNYMFSDGDCYDRDGDTLDGYTAEFLTQHQLEKRIAPTPSAAETVPSS